jgi:hypothetical protein
MLPSYREYRPPSGLEPVVACLWEHEPGEVHSQRVVPDGCVDLIWLAERELVIAGADTGPRVVALPAGTRSSGIRLRHGAAGYASQAHMSDEVRRLTGLTPVRFLEDAQLTAA